MLAFQKLTPRCCKRTINARLEAQDRLAEAAHRFLARAPSRLLLVQLEDLLGEVEQMNLPGTIDEDLNWRRKLTTRPSRPCSMERKSSSRRW